MTAFTNLSYTEFDTTLQTLVSDLLDNILLSASWSKISSTAQLAVTATTATAAAGTVLTFTSGVPAAAGIVVGTVIRIGEKGAADCEYRTVTAVAATTVTVAAVTYAHAIGTKIYLGNEILKATTTRGADMIVDLMDSHMTVLSAGMNLKTWVTHTGAQGGGTDGVNRYLYHRTSANGTAATPIHCVVSVSKEHIYISLEGPRASETNPISTLYGSHRNYFFMSDVVPYFGGDATPCVFSGGNPVNAAAGTSNVSEFGSVSKNQQASARQVSGRLLSLAIPAVQAVRGANVQRTAYGDGNYYLAPYVLFEDINGIRGRLAAFFNAGCMTPDLADQQQGLTPPPVGTKITYDGNSYKLLSPNRSGDSNVTFAQLGVAANSNANGPSVVIAVPCT